MRQLLFFIKITREELTESFAVGYNFIKLQVNKLHLEGEGYERITKAD